MVDVSITEGKLILHVRGADKLWALKSSLEIPLQHIAGVRADPNVAHGWYHGIRMPGTNIPGVITAGTFYQHGQRVFWDVHNPENTIVIELREERYNELIVEVADPHAFFARAGFDVTVVDYSDVGLQELRRKAAESGAGERIHPLVHDIRKPLQFGLSSFEGVYSHMLYCMALIEAELVALSAEIRRVLVPGGLNVFTVRTKQDAHYGTGIHRGEDMYEVGGFIVHFFDRAKVEAVSNGFDIVSIQEFEEGGLPRRLFLVTVRKPK